MACEDESQECKDAMAEYVQAQYDKGVADGRIAQLIDGRNGFGATAVTGAGIVVAVLLVSNPVGWVIAIGVAGAAAVVGGGTGTVTMQVYLRQARSECAAARARMFDAYRRGKQHCRAAECAPPRDFGSSCA